MKERILQDEYFVVNGRKDIMSQRLRVKGPNGEVFRNGIGVASSPATETLHQWRELWKYGAGAIVIKTANHVQNLGFPLQIQTRINRYEEGNLITLENIGKTSIEQRPIHELSEGIKEAWEEGIFVIPSIASKDADLSTWRSMIDIVASTGVSYFESTLRYPYRGILRQVVNELRETHGYFDFDFNEYSIGIVPPAICQRAGVDMRYIENETNRRFEVFLRFIGQYSNQKGIGMIAKLWGGRHDLPALVATCALAGVKGITLINSFQSPPLKEFSDMKTYKRANVSGADLRRTRNASLETAKKVFEYSNLPKVTLFASGGVAVELASQDKESVEQAIEDIILCLELGADMTQLYTAIHQDYTRLGGLIQRLGERLEKEKKTFGEFGRDRSRFTGQNQPVYRLFQINQDSCIGCGLCEKTAYCDAIWPTKRKTAINKKLPTFEIHPNDCTGCGLCAKVCPVENTIIPHYGERNYDT